MLLVLCLSTYLPTYHTVLKYNAAWNPVCVFYHEFSSSIVCVNGRHPGRHLCRFVLRQNEQIDFSVELEKPKQRNKRFKRKFVNVTNCV